MLVVASLFGTVIIVVCIVAVVVGAIFLFRTRSGYSQIGKTGGLWLQNREEEPGERHEDPHLGTPER
jgi:hypothetical protein